MSQKPAEKAAQEDEPAAGDGRTAFDALNPWGDFGAPPSRGATLGLAVAFLVSLGAATGVGFVWAKDLFPRQAPSPVAAATPAEEPAPEEEEPAPEAEEPAPEDPEPEEPAPEEPAPEEPVAEEDEAAPEEPAVPEAAPAVTPKNPKVNKRPPPPPPPGAVVLLGAKDRSRSGLTGLDAALEEAVLDALPALLRSRELRRGAELAEGELGLQLTLRAIVVDEGPRRSRVRADCLAGVHHQGERRPLARLTESQWSRGPSTSQELPREAAAECGRALARSISKLPEVSQ